MFAGTKFYIVSDGLFRSDTVCSAAQCLKAGAVFSIQVVINKRFLLNPEKILAQIRLVVREKRKNPQFNSEKWRHRLLE